MGALTTSFENDNLNHWFRNADIPGIGDAGGLRGSVTAGSWYMSACTTWPGETADQTTGEATYTGYTRQAIPRSSAGWNAASSGSIALAADVMFGVRTDTGAQQDIMFAIIGDSSSGTGIARWWAVVGDSTFVARPFMATDVSTDVLFVPAHGLATDDRIVFFAFEGPSPFPTGLTEGTVYFVRSGGLTTDAFTVATTSGGAAVNITALGSGIAVKVKPIKVNTNINPGIQANALVMLS